MRSITSLFRVVFLMVALVLSILAAVASTISPKDTGSVLAMPVFASLPSQAAPAPVTPTVPVLPAQSPITFSTVYVPSQKLFAPMLGYRLTTLKSLLGNKRLNPEVFVLAGYDLAKSRIVGGGALLFTAPLAQNVSAEFGPGLVRTSDNRIHGAFVATITIRL